MDAYQRKMKKYRKEKMSNQEIKNLNALATVITLREGKKKPLDIAQVKESLRIICQLMVEEPQIIALMIKNGSRK